MGKAIYRFERRGRTPKAIAIVGAIWVMLAMLWAAYDIAIGIAALGAAFTLPALWDVVRDNRSFVEVGQSRIVWSSVLGQGARNDLASVRLNRRFDGSFRIILVHTCGATTQLPADIAPPIAQLEDALSRAGIAIQRNPFSIF